MLEVFAYGGGVQSNAALVLAATGRLDVRTFLFCFCNVGDNSEDPATLEYVERVARPYAAANGIELIELQRRSSGRPSAPRPPIRPAARACTADRVPLNSPWGRQPVRNHDVVTEAIQMTIAAG